MRPSDIRIEESDVTFSDERLAVPLRLSKGIITEITYTRVTVRVRTRNGAHSRGTGAILLSDLWAFPDARFSHAQKDAAMRRLCVEMANIARTDGEFGDPLQKGVQLEERLPQVVQQVERAGNLPAGSVPYLAALNCLASLDAAIHDAWGRAMGGPVYERYTERWLNEDLSRYLGPSFTALYPQTFLGKRRRSLVVQHLVGGGDPLAPEQADATNNAPLKLPVDLGGWIARDGVFCFKIKTGGKDPLADARRVIDVYRTAVAARTAWPTCPIHLSIDPNEACEHPDILVEMLAYLGENAPEVLQALDYIEQPTPRYLAGYNFTLHEVSRQKPVIIDESLETLETLHHLAEQGWSGLALKTCKGQTHSLLAYCWAKHHDMYVTLQDLTNPGLALVHSANFCSYLDLSVNSFESNSRQYMPDACADEQYLYPEYFHVHGGWLTLDRTEGLAGLY